MDDFCADLKAHREAMGLSLDDLFVRTRINPAFFEAIESGRFDVLPEAYIRLFLKKYAQEVDLSVRDVLSRYEAFRNPSGASGSQRPPLKSLPRPSTGWVLAVSFGLFLVIVMLAYRGQFDFPWAFQGEDVQVAEGPESSGRAQPQDAEEAAVPRERVVAAYFLSPTFSIDDQDSVLTLTGRALKAARVAVSSDGERIFEGPLSADARGNWDARDRFAVEIEDAATLSLSLQGHPLESPDEIGLKLRLSISRSGIWVEEIELTPALPSTRNADR